MTYGQLVSQYIGERYTLSQEVAIQRQRESKPEEFAEYNAFCEACKVRAKADLDAVNAAEEQAKADRIAAAEARAKHEEEKAKREAEREAEKAKREAEREAKKAAQNGDEAEK